MMNEFNSTYGLSSVIRGTSGCARTFCVSPACDGLMEELTKQLFLFNGEFGNHDKKLIFSLNVPLCTASYLCEKLKLGRFLLVRMSDTGISAEGYVQVLSDRFSFKEQQQQCALVDRSEELPYNRCISNGNIELKSNMFDIRIPLESYRQVVRKMDDMITERKQKYAEYAALFEESLRYSIADWGLAKEQRYYRELLFGSNYYKRYEHDNNGNI